MVALALAEIGVYGITSYLVDQRQQEIGVRLALGTTPVMIQVSVFSPRLILGCSGIVFGLAGAFALGNILESMLRRVVGTDLVGFSWTALILLLFSRCAPRESTL